MEFDHEVSRPPARGPDRPPAARVAEPAGRVAGAASTRSGLGLLALAPTLALSLALVLALVSIAPAQDRGGDRGEGPGADGEPAVEEEAGGPPAGGPGGGGPPPALVRVGEVVRESLRRRWAVVGRLEPVKQGMAPAEGRGRLVEVTVEEGDLVVGGETVLARIEDTWANLDLSTARAELAEAEAMVARAKADVVRFARNAQYLEDLQAGGTARPKEVDDARDELAAAEAQLQQAEAQVQVKQAQLARVEQELAKLEVVAPFDGVVIEQMAETGEWVEQGTPIVSMVSTGHIDARIFVPERFINALNDGDEIEVWIDPLERGETGRIEAIIPISSAAARTFPVIVRLDNPGGRLKAGMSVTVHIPLTDRQEFITVPRDAVTRRADGASLWKVNPGQPMPIAMPVDVRVLFGAGDRLAVRAVGSLAEGDRVVVEGQDRLFPTQPLIITPDGPPAAASGDASVSEAAAGSEAAGG